MSEEVKKENGNIKKFLNLLTGVVVILTGAFLTHRYFQQFKDLIKGCIGPFLILVGFIIVAIAKE